MDFDDAEYDQLKHRREHRIVSLVFAFVIAGAGIVEGSGKSVGMLVFPLAAIWFADELADDERHASGWLTCRQRALAFRWAGWFGLVALAIFAAIRWRH